MASPPRGLSLPHGVGVRDVGEDGVEVVDALDGFDLDHDRRLAVHILVDGFGGIAGRVATPGMRR